MEARLSAELTNLRTGAIVWTGDVTETSKVDQRNVNSVVSEMSAVLQTSIQHLLASMRQEVSSAETAMRP